MIITVKAKVVNKRKKEKVETLEINIKYFLLQNMKIMQIEKIQDTFLKFAFKINKMNILYTYSICE